MGKVAKRKVDKSYPKGCFVPWKMECWLTGPVCKTYQDFQNARRALYPKQQRA